MKCEDILGEFQYVPVVADIDKKIMKVARKMYIDRIKIGLLKDEIRK